MPKQADYIMRWSQVQGAYELACPPLVFSLTSLEALHAWLDRLDTVLFCSATGTSYTLRKETKERGGDYWYAYKRIREKVRKIYLGRTEKLTFSFLESTAILLARMANPDAFSTPPPRQKPPPREQTRATGTPPRQEPPKTPPRRPTLVFTKSLSSALTIFGFTVAPDRTSLIIRYRELSKQHHPDTGGLHEDMVAVNLAYDYLKKFL